jgi:competence/damage-inducible protein CinA-like protein
MEIELVTIGTELVLGFTVDTNGAFAGQRLAEVGVRLARRTSVRDDPAEIRAAVAEGLSRGRLVITTGGLGPTRDDMTKKVVADLFDAPLELQESIWDDLVARFAKLGRRISPTNRTQAEVPRGAQVLRNRRGTAPGLWLAGPPGEVILLPGVPYEMRGLLVEEVIPRLVDRGGAGAAIVSAMVRTTGLPESAVGERVGPLEADLAPLSVAYLPGYDGVDLRLTAWGLPPEEARARLAAATDRLRAVFAGHVYGTGDDDLAAVLLAECRRRGLTLAVAESCTGGLIGSRVAAVPGASDVFLGGVIAYANEVKAGLLDVPPTVLAEHGAVSEPVVRAMVEGALRRTGASVAVAITGIAGPDGGTAEKPVGTVWFGFGANGAVDAVRVGLPGSRHDVQARAAQAALHGLWRRVTAVR